MVPLAELVTPTTIDQSVLTAGTATPRNPETELAELKVTAEADPLEATVSEEEGEFHAGPVIQPEKPTADGLQDVPPAVNAAGVQLDKPESGTEIPAQTGVKLAQGTVEMLASQTGGEATREVVLADSMEDPKASGLGAGQQDDKPASTDISLLETTKPALANDPLLDLEAKGA